jgi:hypothetical protein
MSIYYIYNMYIIKVIIVNNNNSNFIKIKLEKYQKNISMAYI